MTRAANRLAVIGAAALAVAAGGSQFIATAKDSTAKTDAVNCVPPATVQRYEPVPGGFAIANGGAQFSRPLYGWHGDDNEDRPKRSMMLAGDRPEVALKIAKGMRMEPNIRGVLRFGDGTEDVRFRYVWGRAEYELVGKGGVKMVRSAQSDGLIVETAGDVPHAFDGEWMLAGQDVRDGRKYYDFERKGMERKHPGATVAEMFDAATDRVERIARTIEIKTPDPVLDSLLPCQLVAADAMFEGRIICHGVTTWRMPYAGWRGAYACLATGWSERFKENARLYFKAQKPDGRIPCQPKRDDVCNMNEVFVDAVMRYWRWSGDDAFLRECAYDGVKRHLEWMEANMKVPGEELFENWLDAWNTDNKWCNGGAGTIASSYTAFAYRTMAEAAERLGKPEDAAHFATRAKAIEGAIRSRLWNEADGVWGEYRERFGLGRLVPCPDLSTVYTAIDGLEPDLARNRSAVRWVAENVPVHSTADGAQLLYSSNRLPMFYSSCGRYQNEVFHWALACYQADEPELGWRHLHDAAALSVRGLSCGPGATFYDLDFDLSPRMGHDFSDSIGTFLRAIVEGVFGIRNGKAGAPSFPDSWNEASIKMPGVSFHWKREAEFVDLSAFYNQNLRTLHARSYSPRIKRFAWLKGGERTLMANGRSQWERHEVVDNRKWPKDWCVPKKLDWPGDGILKTEYGADFALGGANASNAVFTALYDQFPDEVSIPLTGKAEKIALLTVLSTNPNVAWLEAAAITVEYADGTSASLSLLPPDNCDDWLSYSHGQWTYLDPEKDCHPYAIHGRPVMFGEIAHGNVHTMALDPSKELKSLRFACRGTETLAGLLGATLYRSRPKEL